jgi:hypothetical protein
VISEVHYLNSKIETRNSKFLFLILIFGFFKIRILDFFLKSFSLSCSATIWRLLCHSLLRSDLYSARDEAIRVIRDFGFYLSVIIILQRCRDQEGSSSDLVLQSL